MKKILLTIALIATIAQAENVVHYDQKGELETPISKPNHPSQEIYLLKN